MKTWLESAEDCFNTKKDMLSVSIVNTSQFDYLLDEFDCQFGMSHKKAVWFLLFMSAIHKEI